MRPTEAVEADMSAGIASLGDMSAGDVSAGDGMTGDGAAAAVRCR